jgi:hypothetical protein
MPDLLRITRSTENDSGTTTTSYRVGFTWVSTLLTWGGLLIALASFCLNLTNIIHKW